MPTCQNCGAHITDQFRRVFAGNSGQVHGCPDCMHMTEIVDGGAARKEA